MCSDFRDLPLDRKLVLERLRSAVLEGNLVVESQLLLSDEHLLAGQHLH